MLMQSSKLAWQFYRNERHLSNYKHLRYIYIILMVFVMTLGQSSQSVQQYLSNNLSSLLGADVIVSQSMPLTDKQRSVIESHSSQIVETESISTTLTFFDKWSRVKLKAVGSDYPLQGQLRASSVLGGDDQVMEFGPGLGEIWLDARLVTSLGVETGDVLSVASESFRVTKVLVHEPDRLMEGHNVDMRAMINRNDLPRLNISNELVTRRYLLAANPQQVSALIDYKNTTLPAAQIFHRKGAHPLALFWQRVENFLGLASIVLFFMAAIAIEQISQLQVKKEQYFSAVCMSMGATKRQGLSLSILKWVYRTVFIMPWVFALTAISHYAVVDWLSSTFQGLQWQWSWVVAFKSALAAIVIFLITQAPVWIALNRVSVSKLLQGRDKVSASWLTKLCSMMVLVIVGLVYTDNPLLTTMIVSSIIICILLIILVSWLTLTVGERLTKNVSGLLPFSLFMMRQRIVTKSTQILGVGLSAFLLLFTLMLMKDLSGTMSNYQRQHDGNLFVSQASESQMQTINQWASEQEIDIRQSKPFFYAKLIEVNKASLDQFSERPSETLATFQRAIRLHYTDEVPSNNRVLSGKWWQEDTQDWRQVSVEEEVLVDLGLSLGDQLTFVINGQAVEFTIVATHAYKPGAGSITFWVQMPISAIDHINAETYSMASLELAPQHFDMLADLWRQHPTLRMMSLNELTARFDKTLAMVTQVISGFSILIILLAMIVTVTSVKALEIGEKKKNSIILSFGFTKLTALRLSFIEWVTTGLIAAAGATVSTYLAGLMIYQSQFSLTYQPNTAWLLSVVAVILSLVVATGIWASKNSLSSSIRELLAE